MNLSYSVTFAHDGKKVLQHVGYQHGGLHVLHYPAITMYGDNVDIMDIIGHVGIVP